jgi:hypothetical protein
MKTGTNIPTVNVMAENQEKCNTVTWVDVQDGMGTNGARYVVNIMFLFSQSFGSTALYLLTLHVMFLTLIPSPQVTEHYNWKTKNIKNSAN